MKGSIQLRKDRGVYYVAWYHAPHGKTYKIYRYRGLLCETKSLAEKLLASMQADAENGFFRIDKYTKEIPTDVIPYLWEWLTAVGPTLKPGTYKDYNNSIKNYLEPFFKAHSIQLHEIQLDTLTLLLNSIDRTGKGKMNVMYCLHACLDFAWRSGRIQAVPPFPRRKQYGIVEPTIQWLPEERQMAIIKAIDPIHQPIFWWLKYHFRRPGEAQALHKEDFDGEVFTIHRTFSDKKLVERTKTGEVHHIPCHEAFRPFVKEMRKREREMGIISPYFFVNHKGKMPGRYYTNKFLNDTW